MIESENIINSPGIFELIKTIILIIIIITIITVIFIFYLFNFISKPISEIYNVIKEVEKGNYNVSLDVKTGDEIEILSKTINKTVASLKKVIEYRKDLDKAKADFLSITSHELRNPLTPMKIQLQILENEYFGKLTEKQKESIGLIIKNSDRLDKLICDFQDISRIESAGLSFNFNEIHIAEIVKETVTFMDSIAKEKNIKLESDIGIIPSIKADPDRISQVLRNLIYNSIKFSNENSKIIIRAHKKDEYILLSVQDYGCGLSLENQKRVFEPFYQVENTNLNCFKGTGLGLAICRGIVESQKGKIWVESKINEGSKFYFTIPLKPVEEIKPIKVLFSGIEMVDKELNKKFVKIKKDINSNKKISVDVKKFFNKNKENGAKNKIKLGGQNNFRFEKKLSEQKFDAVFIMDDRANILDCNKNMSTLLGYTKSEIKSLNLSDIDVLESKKDIIDKIKKIKKYGVFSFKTIHKRKDGSMILVNENLQYIKNKNWFKSIVREDHNAKKH
jgi:PAS domain S-box-containing protein